MGQGIGTLIVVGYLVLTFVIGIRKKVQAAREEESRRAACRTARRVQQGMDESDPGTASGAGYVETAVNRAEPTGVREQLQRFRQESASRGTAVPPPMPSAAVFSETASVGTTNPAAPPPSLRERRAADPRRRRAESNGVSTATPVSLPPQVPGSAPPPVSTAAAYSHKTQESGTATPVGVVSADELVPLFRNRSAVARIFVLNEIFRTPPGARPDSEFSGEH